MKLKPPKKKIQNPSFRIEYNNGKIFTKISNTDGLLPVFFGAVQNEDTFDAIKKATAKLVMAICVVDEEYANTMEKMLDEFKNT